MGGKIKDAKEWRFLKSGSEIAGLKKNIANYCDLFLLRKKVKNFGKQTATVAIDNNKNNNNNDNNDNNLDDNPDLDLLTDEKIRLKRPSMYRIVLINDDYTPQEFVIWVLMKIFHKTKEEGTQIMLDAHKRGKSSIGVYTYDIAKTKLLQVIDLAKKNEHPLECRMEAISGEEEWKFQLNWIRP